MLRIKRKFKLYLRDLSDIPYFIYALITTILVISILITKGNLI